MSNGPHKLEEELEEWSVVLVSAITDAHVNHFYRFFNLFQRYCLDFFMSQN